MYEPEKTKITKKSQDRFNVLALSLVSVFLVYRQASLPFGC